MYSAGEYVGTRKNTERHLLCIHNNIITRLLLIFSLFFRLKLCPPKLIALEAGLSFRMIPC